MNFSKRIFYPHPATHTATQCLREGINLVYLAVVPILNGNGVLIDTVGAGRRGFVGVLAGGSQGNERLGSYG